MAMRLYYTIISFHDSWFRTGVSTSEHVVICFDDVLCPAIAFKILAAAHLRNMHARLEPEPLQLVGFCTTSSGSPQPHPKTPAGTLQAFRWKSGQRKCRPFRGSVGVQTTTSSRGRAELCTSDLGWDFPKPSGTGPNCFPLVGTPIPAGHSCDFLIILGSFRTPVFFSAVQLSEKHIVI